MRTLVAILSPVLLGGTVVAGSGEAPISGYAVSEIHYSLDGDAVDGVSFELAPAGAQTVKVRLAPGDPWSPCTVTGGSATCVVSAPLTSVVALEVVAAS